VRAVLLILLSCFPGGDWLILDAWTISPLNPLDQLSLYEFIFLLYLMMKRVDVFFKLVWKIN